MSSPRPIKNPSNSIRYNCQKVCSWWKRPETTLKIRERNKFPRTIVKPIIYKFFKDITNNRKKTTRAVIFGYRPLPNIFKCWNHKWYLSTVWKSNFFRHYGRVQLVFMGVQPHTSSEPPQEYNQDKTPLTNPGWLWSP